MGGIDWAGLPIVAEIVGYDDIELFVHLLTAVRDHFQQQE